MEKEHFINYIHNPKKLSTETLSGLNSITTLFPYFQTAQLLSVKNLQILQDVKFETKLHFTAAYITDRRILYHLLHPMESDGSLNGPENDLLENKVKKIKETLEENISDALTSQIQLSKSENFELIPEISIDVRKEYGQGIELDDDYPFHKVPDLLLLDEKFDQSQPSDQPVQPIPALADATYTDNFLLELDEVPEKKSKKREPDSVSDKITIEITSNRTGPEAKKELYSLIDKFIQVNPRLQPTPEIKTTQDISVDSVKENDGFITDTLAKIYLKQGHYSKAIFAYEKLSLKYPEKSSYFASQIKMIKKIINNL
ncbi:MAG: tetratricopeptide repeat protein [Bacteroidales bacterium]|nr:tetratricopeptide repeat protein [Bacteroidales bacterium]